MEAPVSIFQESPLAGEPRQRLFHIHSVNRYQLRTKYLHPSTLLWQINGCNFWQQPCIIHWCYLFRCWKFNDVWLNIRVFCAPCVVAEGSALSFADGAAVVCSTSPMASLIRSMKHPLNVVRVESWDSLGLQKYYNFKFKYFIVAYTWQGVYQVCAIKCLTLTKTRLNAI